MLKNIRLGAKMLGGFILVALIVLIVGFFGWNGTRTLQGHIEEIGNISVPGITNLQSIKIESNAMRTAIRTMLNTRLSKTDKQRQYTNIEALRGRYQTAFDTYTSLPQTTEEARIWKDFVTAWDSWREVNNQILEMARQIDETDILNPDALKGDIVGFIRDHHILMEKILELLLKGDSFLGGEDSTACAFGHWLASFETTNPAISALVAEVHQYHDPFHESVAEIKELVDRGEIRQAVNIYETRTKPNAAKVFEIFTRLENLSAEVSGIYDSMNVLALGSATDLQNKAVGLLDQVIDINDQMVHENMTEAHEAGSAVALVTVIGMIAGVLLSLISGIFLTRLITVPMAKGVEFASAIASGDLTAELAVDQKDEIGQLALALKQMAEKLKSIVADVRTAADNVASGSRELSNSSVQMSTGATEQASSAEEVSSAIEEMGANIQQNTSNASQTEKISTKSAKDAEEGGSAVNEAVEAMNQIAEKIKVIESIARETNMLSLNAAIEAARAGEHGKGFAVVASEVGKLAANSQKASVEIQKLALSSVEKANAAREKIQSIVPDIKRTAELVVEIAAASSEQNSGAEQINQAMMQLDTVIQQNAAIAEESSSMSEELTSQAEQLLDLISFFKVDDSGSRRLRNTGSGQELSRRKTPSSRKGSSEEVPGKPATAARPARLPGKSSEEPDGFEEF